MTNIMVIMRNMARRVDLSITRNGDTKNPNINHFPLTKLSSCPFYLPLVVAATTTVQNYSKNHLFIFLLLYKSMYNDKYTLRLEKHFHMCVCLCRLYA